MLNKLKSKFEAGKILTAVAVGAIIVFLNNAGTHAQLFGTALLFAALHSGAGVLTFSAVFLASFLFDFSFNRFICAVFASGVLCLIYGVFGKKKRLGSAALVFLPFSLIPYVLIDGSEQYLPRIVTVTVITVLGAAFLPGVGAVAKRGFRKPERVEIFSLALIYVCAFIGGIKYIGADGYRAFALLMTFCLSALLSGSEACTFAFIAAIPHALSYRNAEIILPYVIFGAGCYMLANVPKPVFAIAMLSLELCCGYVFGFLGNYGYVNLIYFCASVIIYVLLPKRLFERCAERLALSCDKPLSRYEINRTRNIVSSRLYEISGTFREISELFNTLSGTENPFLYEDAILSETAKICEGCSFRQKCKAVGFPTKEELIRLIAIGKGKGRLNAVDLPKKFTQKCTQTGKIVFAINKYVNLYSTEMEKQRATESTRALVGLQAEGIASALKGMAKTLAKDLSYRTDKERKLSGFLLKKGVNVQEIMIFGEGEGMEIHLTVISQGEDERIRPAVNEFFKARFNITERFDLKGNRVTLVLERACRYDCIFGVSSVKKNGEEACGDTHSLIKIDRNKFMLALSDGMGSGEMARVTSEASLSLIECFYRAGLPGEVSLSTVNKLLSFTGEDNFAALDLGVINLESLTCDFIKLGAPYGFIVSKGTVKMIEGSSLPMGILSELKPSVCSEQLAPGDVILFLSDGVTDAFGSATDFADYLAAASVINPQKLADKILDEALALYGNTAEDDMTVVACKIFAC